MALSVTFIHIEGVVIAVGLASVEFLSQQFSF